MTYDDQPVRRDWTSRSLVMKRQGWHTRSSKQDHRWLPVLLAVGTLMLWFLSVLFFTLFQTIRNIKQDRSAVGKYNTHRTVEGQCALAQAREQPTKRRQRSDWTQNVKPADTGKQTHSNILDSECTHTQKEVQGARCLRVGGGLHALGSPGRVNIHLNRQKSTRCQSYTVRRRKKNRRQNMGLWQRSFGAHQNAYWWCYHHPKGHLRFNTIQTSVQIDLKGE